MQAYEKPLAWSLKPYGLPMQFPGYIPVVYRDIPMSYLIKDEEVLSTFRRLAKGRGKTLADLLRDLARQEAGREAAKLSTLQRLQPVLAKARALGQHPPVDWEAEKRASDEMWGE